MHTTRSPRILWTLAAATVALGLAGTASVALALSGGPTVPASANSLAGSAVASDSDTETDSAEPTDSDEPTETDEPSESGTPDATPVGPDATGPAAFGLCNAYAHAKVHGKSVGHSIAFRNLAAAAGGVDQIDAYCATVLHPGSPASSSPSHPTGRPDTVPSHSHPNGD